MADTDSKPDAEGIPWDGPPKRGRHPGKYQPPRYDVDAFAREKAKGATTVEAMTAAGHTGSDAAKQAAGARFQKRPDVVAALDREHGRSLTEIRKRKLDAIKSDALDVLAHLVEQAKAGKMSDANALRLVDMLDPLGQRAQGGAPVVQVLALGDTARRDLRKLQADRDVQRDALDLLEDMTGEGEPSTNGVRVEVHEQGGEADGMV